MSVQSLVVREFDTMFSAQRCAEKVQTVLDDIRINRNNKNTLKVVCNKVDEGCVQVEIIGDFGDWALPKFN